MSNISNIVNFFDKTKLEFDPAEKKEKTIKDTVERVQKGLQGAIGQSASKEKEKLEKEKFDEVAKLVVTDTGVDMEAFRSIASDRREHEKKKLENRIEIEKETGRISSITKSKIKSIRKKTGLSEASIREVYERHGITVSEEDPTKAYPKFPSNVKKLHSLLASLRAAEDKNPNAVDKSGVMDFYDYIAYICGEPKDGDRYRGNRNTAELKRILDEHSISVQKRTDNIGKLLKDISSLGKTNILDSEEHRKAYANYLLYIGPELTAAFEKMKLFTPEELLEPSLAEPFIDVIFEVFKDDAVAIAIYNEEAGLKDSPYERLKKIFRLKCSHCRNTVVFDDFEHAKSVNKCSHCGKELFKSCPNCKKLILTDSNKCPECNFRLADAVEFVRNMELAEAAFKRGDLVTARSFLLEAKLCDPSEKQRTGALEERLDQEEAKYAEPLKKLNSLIGTKRFRQAEAYLATVTAKYPGLDVTKQIEQVKDVINECRRKQNAAPVVNTAIDILEICADYEWAVEFLRAHPPAPCADFKVVADANSSRLMLTWKPSGERGVKYTLVRKAGKAAPTSEMDGETIAEGLVENGYSDTSVRAGMFYTYALFAKRGSSVSKGVAAGGVAYPPVSDVKISQQKGGVHISWVLPEGCKGVEVKKRVDGADFQWNNLVSNSFDDSSIKNNTQHIYNLVCVYEAGRSKTVSVSFVPTASVGEFGISTKMAKNGSCEVSWDIRQSGVEIDILVNGKSVTRVDSGNKTVSISLAKNGYYVISARVLSSGEWIESRNRIGINTFEAPGINATIEDEQYSRSLGGLSVRFAIRLTNNLPAGVKSIMYFVRKKGDRAQWVEPGEAMKASDKNVITPEQYKVKGYIEHQLQAQDEENYYITVYAIYDVNGKEILSNPSKQRVTRQLNLDIHWKITKGYLTGRKLEIQTSGNRAFSRRIPMVLCASRSERLLMTPDDPNGIKLLTIPERMLDRPRTEISENFDLDGIKIGRDQKLFMFKLEDINGEDVTFRWAKGFNGKG